MRIAVTGATGNLGTALLAALRRSDEVGAIERESPVVRIRPALVFQRKAATEIRCRAASGS